MPRQHKLFWGSSYDRGLDILLKMWPRIREKFPDATLDCCYGWDLFDRGYANNPERMAWKERINKAMEMPGITHHGRVGKAKLQKIRRQCGIWVYPTYFTEINCITALECQKDGVVPCVMDLAALAETVQSGEKVAGDIYDPEVQESFLKALYGLMGDTKRWEMEAKKAQAFTRDFTWDKIASQWTTYMG